jgi:hypothetical protein
MINTTPRPLYPGNEPALIARETGLTPRAGVNGCGKSLPASEYDPLIDQHVASHYTDWAIPVEYFLLRKGNCFSKWKLSFHSHSKVYIHLLVQSHPCSTTSALYLYCAVLSKEPNNRRCWIYTFETWHQISLHWSFQVTRPRTRSYVNSLYHAEL